MIYCTKCGNELLEGTKFCSGCGSKLIDEEHENTNENGDKSDKETSKGKVKKESILVNAKVGTAIMVVVLLGAGLLSTYRLVQSSSTVDVKPVSKPVSKPVVKAAVLAETPAKYFDWGVSDTAYIAGIKFDKAANCVIVIPKLYKGKPVVEIIPNLFSGCTGLTAITIPDYVSSIGSSEFSGCVKLAYVKLPSYLVNIQSSMFDGCSSLNNIIIPNNVQFIDPYAFNKCVSLTSIKIPESVKTIGEGAFSTCYSLADVYIPDGVITIGQEAFKECAANLTIHTPADSFANSNRNLFPDGTTFVTN
ncbi:leucine-rich repeat protein [Clostridium estertheticum]|uniref:leucine-rich repeat protein n=1 Tax=Clostridium estertheticum TaxID=238834 RepID=UPI001C6E587B|nr:leucine-rich repeat domain-containing protein [Clostridium estertheticum]MBW9172918.1 leucine-rich repeat protein [Clostridium estertheticum]WLC75242.1 leucine-rich repeat protein [Clostridium estertheticum]